MGSLFDDLAFVENEDPVHTREGRKAVGDHESGAPLHEFLEAILDVPLGDRVER